MNDFMVLHESSDHAGRAFRLPHNITRHVSISRPHSYTPPAKRRRELTPAVELEPKSAIKLAFSHLPHDISRGFVLGSDAELCDILFTARKSSEGVSRVQFRITFNWQTGQPLLIDESTYGTMVDSKIFGPCDLKRNVIPLADEDSIQVALIVMRVNFSSRGRFYSQHWEDYRAKYYSTIPRIERLFIPAPTPLRTVVNPLQLSRIQTVGADAEGIVEKAIGCDGDFYAVKHSILRYRDPRFETEFELLSSLSHVGGCYIYP